MGMYSLSNIEAIASGDEAFVREMVEAFLDAVSEGLNIMNRAFASQDWEALRAAAHKLKPTIDLMEVHEVTQTIREVQRRAGEQDNPEGLQPELDKLNHILPQVAEELKAKFA